MLPGRYAGDRHKASQRPIQSLIKSPKSPTTGNPESESESESESDSDSESKDTSAGSERVSRRDSGWNWTIIGSSEAIASFKPILAL